MPDDAVLYSKEGEVAVLRLNLPQYFNAIEPRLQYGLLGGLEQAMSDQAKALVIHGGERGFCSGANLKVVARLAAEAADGSALRRMIDRATAVQVALREAPMVTVSAVNGVAVGAGIGLALVADFCVAERSAKFVTRFASIGVTPDNGTSALITARIGAVRATQLFLRDQPMSAQEFLDLGLVDAVVDDGTALDEAVKLASEFSVSRVSVAGIRGLVEAAGRNSFAAQMQLEADWAARATASAEFRASNEKHGPA